MRCLCSQTLLYSAGLYGICFPMIVAKSSATLPNVCQIIIASYFECHSSAYSVVSSIAYESIAKFILQVSTSEHIDAKHILLILPSCSFPELRALLLEKMGQHLEALRLHLFGLRHNKLLACSFGPLSPLHDL